MVEVRGVNVHGDVAGVVGGRDRSEKRRLTHPRLVRGKGGAVAVVSSLCVDVDAAELDVVKEAVV